MGNIFEPLVFKTALELISLINDDLKEKEKYELKWYTNHDKLYVFAIQDKENLLFNVIDDMGEIPDGFSVNWRTFSHIKKELLIA